MNKGAEFLYSVSDILRLQQYLDQNKNLDLSEMRDQKKNSVLHNAAFNNRFEIIKIFLEHIKRIYQGEYWKNNNVYKKPVKQAIQALINDGNSQGFTCIHYAAYKGNVEMLKLFESLGGNLMATSKTGFTILHSAAQGNKLAPILYLYKKSELTMSFNITDRKKSTLLHEAAKAGSQSVVEFLLAQPEIELDSFDSDNQTALHLAVHNGRTKIVKRLLIKGADRTLTNGEGKKPIDIALSMEFNQIANILNNQYRFRDHLKFYCNVKTRYQPQSRSYIRSFLFLLAFLYVAVCSHLLIIPTFNIAILYTAAGFNALLIILFIILLIQPSRPEPMEYKDLIYKLPICSQCKIPMQPRMHHCDICKVCVQQYDHHCPWINGCVGKHNIRLFPCFLALLVLLMLENAFLSVVGIFQLDFMFKQYRYFGAVSETIDILKIQYRLFMGLSLLIIVLFIVPVSALLYYQISNLFYNITTYERFSLQPTTALQRSMDASQQNDSSERLLNKQDQECSFRNCGIMCSREPEQQETVKQDDY